MNRSRVFNSLGCLLATSLISNAASASQFKWFDAESIPRHTIQMMKDGPATFAERLNLVRTAQYSIVMSTYAYKDDEAGKTLADALCAAANRGVDVRIVLDGFGSAPVRGYISDYRECGLHVVYDGYAHFGPTDKLFVTHDKLLIADGERMIMGGSGIANYYRDYGRNSKEWHDLDFKIEGSTACFYQRKFAENWERYRKSSVPRDPFDFSREQRQPDLTEANRMFGATPVPSCHATNFGNSNILPLYNNPFYERNKPVPAALNAINNLFPLIEKIDFPDRVRRPNIEHEVQAIRDSKKEILLYGAYFVAHDAVIEALLNARKKTKDHEPVDITIITNSDESNDDLPALVTAMYKRVIPLIEAGVKIQLWTTKGQTMHRKGGIFDNELVFFGSDNLDIRGQNYSSESIAFTDDDQIVARMRSEFLEDLKSTRNIDKEDAIQGWKDSSFKRKVGATVMKPFL